MATPPPGATHPAGRSDAPPAPDPEPSAEALRERLVERLVARAAQREDGVVEDVEGLDPLPALEGGPVFWARIPPSSRRARVSREEIARAAVRLADGEGIDAVSMRRLATELGVGTMTLYHHVHTKDEVLALALDTAMGEVVVAPGELPEDWREAMTLLARRTRDVARRHPWTIALHGSVAYGPSTIRHYDQSLQAVRDIDAPFEVKLDVVATLDEFVFGFCLAEHTGLIQEPTPALLDYVEVLLETGAYPELTRLAGEEGMGPVLDRLRSHATDDARFDRNLERVLDGLAATLPRR